ncbi:MAG TPA: TonB family protein [Pyrinomonadaceae bacterium]
MQKRLFLFILMILCAGLSNLYAQEAAQTPAMKTISGGVVNGKATSLVKPAYPAAARAVNAQGAVNVQVTIDEEGNVISASAVSGHPLLRAAAVQAARASKFSPTRMSGQPVKVTGIVVYNFVANPEIRSEARTANWFQAGQTLAALDGIKTLRFVQPSALNNMIPADWTAERDQIKRLEELKQAEIETSQGDAPKERVIDERVVSDANKNQVRTRTMTVTVSPDQKASSEATAISQSLISSIQGRLGGNELDLWYFNLGINVNKALTDADSRSGEKRINGVKPLREFIRNIPEGVPAETRADAEKFAAMAEKGIFTDQDKIELTQIMMRLSPLPQPK